MPTAAEEDVGQSAFPLLERGQEVVVKPAGQGVGQGVGQGAALSRTATALGPHTPPVHWHLIWAGVAANLSAVCGGFVYSWSSPSLPQLKDPSAPAGFVLTEDEAAWVGSLVPLGAAFGPIPGGIFADRFGRRPTLIWSAALMFLAWVLTGVATSAAWLYAARFIGGFVTGVVSCILPLYLGEIAVDRVRSALGSAMQLSLTLGFMVPYSVGPYVAPVWLAVVLASFVAVYGAASLGLPESPHYLLIQGDAEAASRALQWLRGQRRDQCSKELRCMEEDTAACLARRGPVLQTFCRVLATRGGRRAFLLVCALMLFQQLSGINAVLFYAEEIFRRALGTTTTDGESGASWLTPAVCAIIVGLVQVVASTTTVALTAFVSMRSLFAVSALGAAVAHAALGYYFHLVATDGDVSGVTALPLASLVFFIVTYCLGLGSVPWALMGEMFSADAKAVSSSVCASFYWVLGFVVTQLFNRCMEDIGADYTFWGLGACCVLAAVFTLTFLPDTKGRSLKEIQDILNGRK